MRKKLKALRCTNRLLRSKINNDKYNKVLNAVFNKDQIRALLKTGRVRNWSNETVQRALKLKLTCGSNGYEEILKQKIPLPTTRTLRRKLQEFKFEPGICNHTFEFLKYKKIFLQERNRYGMWAHI